MNKNEQIILEEIKNYYQKEKLMPTIRFLQNQLHYHSTNSVAYYLKKLEKKGYLKRNNIGQLIINDFYIFNNQIKIIPVLNINNSFIYDLYPQTKDYVAFKIKNNYFIKNNILKEDILIIERTKALHNNDLGLFIINKKYRLMKYQIKDHFYVLEDYELIFLNKVKIIGKVIAVKRKIKSLE